MGSSIEYAELSAKTNFSFLEGASHPEEMVEQAKVLGLCALGITDRNSLAGVVRAHTAAKEHHFPILIGATIQILKQELHVLAMSRKGYGNLCRLVSMEEKHLEDLARLHSDLLVLLPAPYSDELLPPLSDLLNDRLSIAVHRTLEPSDRTRFDLAKKQSKRFSVPVVAVNDVHYHVATRQPLQDVLTAVRHMVPVTDLGERLFPNAERKLKSPQEMAELFSDIPFALSRSVELAGRCHFSLDELRYQYPDEFLPPGKTAIGYLKELTWEGAKRRYAENIPAGVRRQIAHELKLIEELQFADYFLTIYDIVCFARSQKILCQGRGSAANSVVCYVLGITAIDPVRMNLLFERFISAERGEPPDIDVDFEHERREEVIQYIYKRYGRERAAIVAEVITYREKSAVRDVTKALGSAATPERVSRFVEEIRGFPRHLATHVGGFVLTRDPLIESVPIQKAAMPGRTIIQWDKNDLDALGMLKVDVLGLGMLTCLRKCFALIQDRKLSLSNIPPEDPKVYDMICKADTVGVFQIESRAQMGMLPRLRPRTFHDLVIQIAIVRPGPIIGKMVHPYLRRRRGEEKVRYPHPALKEILGKTFGIPLFQEQVMKIAMAVAGFNPGEADQLRRSMGIWRTARSQSMLALAGRFIEGMKKNRVLEKDAEAIFEQIQSFGEFGFPESHSASFALIAYASAYLKCYSPAEFACALLNSQPMGFYAAHSIVDDVKRHGVQVFPPDLLYSDWDCLIEGGALRLGFRLVRGLGERVGRNIVEMRNQKPFSSLEDVIARTSMNRLHASFLAAADAFSSLGLNSRNALWKLLSIPFARDDLQSGQGLIEVPYRFDPLTPQEKVASDYRVLSLSTFAHPVSLLREDLRRQHVFSVGELGKLPSGRRVKTAGLAIVRQRPPTAKGMVFVTLEDETGMLNIAIPPKVYERDRETIRRESLLWVEGILQRDREALSVLVSGAHGFSENVPPVKGRDFH